MIKALEKHVVTRKPHICYECKREIPKGTKCYWFKSVVFKESDVGRDEWIEFYICPECNELNNAEEEFQEDLDWTYKEHMSIYG